MKTDTEKFIKFLLAFFVILGFNNISYGDIKNSRAGFLDFNVYPYMSDVDADNTININIAAKLPGRFSYFSLNNIGNVDGDSELEDTTTFYTEQNIRWQISDNSPFDLTLQMNFRTGENNDRHRLGARWRLNNSAVLKPIFAAMHLSYSINLHAIQFDKENGHVWQMEHVFKLLFPYLTDKIYLAGFIDHTFNQDLPSGFPSSPIVGEFQFGYRIIDNLYAISEYRVNEYRRSDVNNLAVGIEYKIMW
ncbi:MAG: hypothetical protein V3T17_17635 [Pseudomonadales bacterium]